MRRYFGTDGVRGRAGGKVLNLDFTINLGKSAAKVLPFDSKNRKVIIGKDTRLSSDFIDLALSATFSALGIQVLRTGVISTPALAFLTKHYKAAAGFMISASHNPFYDNGIKIFASNGMKLSDEIEEEIEKHLNDAYIAYATDEQIGKISEVEISPYLQHLRNIIDSLPDFKFLIDCANGSATRILNDWLKLCASNTTLIHNEPDGININDNCGSLFIENLKNKIYDSSYDYGISFDGDADRCLIVNNKGQIIDGDKIIAIFALFLKMKGELRNNRIVVTTMSNLGLLNLMKKEGIEVSITDVGDRYVLAEMLKTDSIIGGEQSGHIINRLYLDTGDGVATFLFFCRVLKEEPQIVEYVMNNFFDYPQVLVNRKVKAKPDLFSIPKIKQKYDEICRMLDSEGRIVLRYSGTEPKVRVMIEGKDTDYITKLANEFADFIVEMINKTG